METPLRALADLLGAKIIGDGDRIIRGVAAVGAASPDEITFVTDAKYLARLGASNAAAAIVTTPTHGLAMPQLVVDNADRALLEVLSFFAEKAEVCAEGVDATARIGRNVTLGQAVGIGPHVVIADDVAIGDGTFVAAGCTIGRGTQVGADCRLHSGVVLYDHCQIGDHVTIQANTVIGSTGFGYVFVDGNHRLIPHIGNVVIEDFVEIGANCCVDRAKFGTTRIGAGTKIDNLVQIAHNVTIGRCCLIAGMTGIAGSCSLGDGVVLAGQVGIRDHITLGDGAMVGGKSFVMQDVKAGEKVFGFPAMEKNQSLRIMHTMRRLPELSTRVQKLETSSKKERTLLFAPQERITGRTVSWAGGAIAAGLLVLALFSLALSSSRAWLDPDEVRVEQLARMYQDGDDLFFVSKDAGLNDLRISDRLFLVGNMDQMIERTLADEKNTGDLYFLIPLSTVERLKVSELRERLFLVTEMAIRGRMYALVTTEADRQFLRL
ncbi:MAG: UDP-3-O-(3-hydroxymyristoyl)glucosamine N-acyltransferase [Phycisphaerae bacterium]|nr:UDP-3-O-(3-hydroxymyristoyl)glucosamine N-acyltransferase [Phycisphaerae bacterium]